MNDFRYSNGIFVQALLVCHSNPDAICVALYLIASDGYSFVAICLSCSIFPRDDSTDRINDVLEAHGQVIESVQLIGRKSSKHDLARKFNFPLQGVETDSDYSLLVFVSPVFFLPRLKAIGFTDRLDRQVNYYLSL